MNACHVQCIECLNFSTKPSLLSEICQYWVGQVDHFYPHNLIVTTYNNGESGI